MLYLYNSKMALPVISGHPHILLLQWGHAAKQMLLVVNDLMILVHIPDFRLTD